MAQHQSAPVAILLHLAHTQHLQEFAAAFEQLGLPFELHVNLVEGINSEEQLDQQQNQVLAQFPRAHIIRSQNRGMDVGGLFRLFARLRSKPRRAALYVHSKSSDQWRRNMLQNLTVNVSDRIGYWSDDAARQGRLPGMIGSHSYPFDYYNIGPFLELMSELDVSLNSDWEAYYRHYPATRGLPLMQRIAHANDQALVQNKSNKLRPEIDLEYAAYLLGDLYAPPQAMNPEKLRQLIRDQVMGPLPYFPGNFFWISLDLVNALAEHIDFEQEYERLPKDLGSDRQFQSRAHAWERALPVFALKNGFTLSSVARANDLSNRETRKTTTA